MGSVAERTEFYKGKAPLVEDFSKQRQGLLGNVAARNFTAVPGQLIGAATELELKLKQALSSLNYDVTAKAIERELTQAGIDYSQSYKESLIQWEIEKAILLDDLTHELADSQKARDDKEQVLAALAVEVSLRQVVIINAKTALELESEGYKQEIEESQGLPLPYEVQLAKEKLATAQKKLAIIPHLQALIDAEESLVVAEETNAGLTESLIIARLDLIPTKEGLADLKQLLIEEKNAFTDPLLSIADKKSALADARLAYETLAAGKIVASNNLAADIGALNAALEAYAIKKEEFVVPELEKAAKMEEMIIPSQAYAAALLETIPCIEDLASARQGLIIPGLARATALGLLINPLLAKAQKTLDYAESMENQSGIELEIKEIAKEIELLKKDGVDADLDVMKKRLEEGDYDKALVEENIILKGLVENNRASLINQDALDTVAYTTVKEDGQVEIVAIEKEAIQTQVDTRAAVSRTKMSARYDSVKTTVGARAGNDGSIEDIASVQAYERKKTAKIAATAKITSKLIHQIS